MKRFVALALTAAIAFSAVPAAFSDNVSADTDSCGDDLELVTEEDIPEDVELTEEVPADEVPAEEEPAEEEQLVPYVDTFHTGDMAPLIEEIISDEEAYNLILEANNLPEETELSDDELDEYVFDRFTHESATIGAYSLYTYDAIYQQMDASEQAFYNNLYGACESYLNSTAYMPSTTTTSGNTYTVCGPVSYDGLYDYQIRYVVFVFMYENPQFFFVNNGFVRNSEYAFLICYPDFASGSARSTAKNNYFSRVTNIVNRACAGTTPYERLKIAHDIICNEVTYVSSSPYNQSAYSAIVNGRSVCAGYAEAMMCIGNAIGVPTISVTSDEHEWNEVYLEGNWYVLDATWDDGDPGTYYDYFLKSYSTIKGYSSWSSQNHTIESLWYYFPCPACNLDWSAYSRSTSVTMYRLYNPNSGEHFYTSNPTERSNLISVGWNDEGIGWIAPSFSDTPVYRLYNRYAGEHHYTTSLDERNNLINNGWLDEGIGWYSDDARGVPLYRQYNPNQFANNHNYTTSYSENQWLVSLGWQAEGIGWYGLG